MDAYFLVKSLERETYANLIPEPGLVYTPKPSLMSTLQLIFSLTISIYAASLAWSAGSSDSMFFRILISVIAFMFSTLYIIGYLIFKGYKQM